MIDPGVLIIQLVAKFIQEWVNAVVDLTVLRLRHAWCFRQAVENRRGQVDQATHGVVGSITLYSEGFRWNSCWRS